MLNGVEFERARESFEGAGEITQALLDELATVARYLIRNGHLPPSYSPYGRWDEEAAQELLGEWVAEKLLRSDGLAALFDTAMTPKAFRALAERSLHQFVLNRRERSQSQNLYERARALVENEEGFVVVRDAKRRQEVVWGLRSDPPRPVFGGGERKLGALAYSLGEFELIRYKDSAAKLAPLLSSAELIRFTEGIISAAGPLSLTQLMHALELRFDLAPVETTSLQADNPPEPDPGRSLEEEVVLRQSALAAITELSSRQSRVLLGRRAEVTIEELSVELGCSVGTITNEQTKIAQVLRRHSNGGGEELELLKIVGDLLYEGSVNDE